MVIKNLKKLLLPIVAISLLFAQTTHAFVYRVDVLAQVIPMPDGTEKIDVALVGSDNHALGTVAANIKQFLCFAKSFDQGDNTVQIFAENPLKSSQFFSLDEHLETDLQKIYIRNFNRNFNNPCTAHNPASCLLSMMGTPYQLIAELDCLTNYSDAEMTHMALQMSKLSKITTSLECRQFSDISAYLMKLTNTNEKRLFDFKQNVSACYENNFIYSLWNLFNEIDAWFDSCISGSKNKAFKKTFKNLKKNNNDQIKKFQNNFAKLYNAQFQTAFSYVDIIELQKRSNTIGFKDLAQIYISSVLQVPVNGFLREMIESVALWHISQAQTRKSNRTISFMGAGHANPKKAFSGSHSFEGLVDYLKNIGYVSLASLDVDKQIKDIKFVDHATQETELDKIIQQTSNFIIDWVKKSDTEVQEILGQGERPTSPGLGNQRLINKQFFSQTTPKTSNSINDDKMSNSNEFDLSNNNRDQLQTADQNDNTLEKIPYNDILQEQSTYTPWSWCTLL